MIQVCLRALTHSCINVHSVHPWVGRKVCQHKLHYLHGLCLICLSNDASDAVLTNLKQGSFRATIGEGPRFFSPLSQHHLSAEQINCPSLFIKCSRGWYMIWENVFDNGALFDVEKFLIDTDTHTRSTPIEHRYSQGMLRQRKVRLEREQ